MGNSSPTASSTLYGKGLFTTLAIVDRRPFLWEKHWRRLTENAVKLEIDSSEFDERLVAKSLADLIEKNKVIEGRVRITFLDESPSELWGGDVEKKTSVSIVAAGRREIPKHFSLTISPHRVNTTSPLVGIKSCNYLEHLMAFDEAKKRGFDEAIRLNERGEITSACMANVFWLKEEKLFTPSLGTGCLAGTTREYVLEHLECEEVEATIEQLKNAEAIFLTSAGIGIVQVADFEAQTLTHSIHPIMTLWPKNMNY